eukprot:2461460-Amphidinium_carterae.2
MSSHGERRVKGAAADHVRRAPGHLHISLDSACSYCVSAFYTRVVRRRTTAFAALWRSLNVQSLIFERACRMPFAYVSLSPPATFPCGIATCQAQ